MTHKVTPKFRKMQKPLTLALPRRVHCPICRTNCELEIVGQHAEFMPSPEVKGTSILIYGLRVYIGAGDEEKMRRAEETLRKRVADGYEIR